MCYIGNSICIHVYIFKCLSAYITVIIFATFVCCLHSCADLVAAANILSTDILNPLKVPPPVSPPLLSSPLFFKKHLRNDTMYDHYLPLCLFICLSVSRSVDLSVCPSVRLFHCLFGSFNNNFDVRILHLAANINNYNYKTCVFLISMRILHVPQPHPPHHRTHCVGLSKIFYLRHGKCPIYMNISKFLNYASVNSFRCRSTNLWQVKNIFMCCLNTLPTVGYSYC